MEALEAETAALKERPGLKYCGVWVQNQTYEPGDCVSFANAIWSSRPSDC